MAIKPRNGKRYACQNSGCQFWVEGVCHNALVGNGEVIASCLFWKKHIDKKEKERGNEAR
jgi:hypothetical protein